MRFAKWVFTIAGIYGILSVAPLYLFEGAVAESMPPPLTHPEYYYGFIGVTLAWQFAFLIIGRDPVRYRLIMLPAIFEKFSYFVSTFALQLTRGVPSTILLFATVDLVLGVLFVISFYLTRKESNL